MRTNQSIETLLAIPATAATESDLLELAAALKAEGRLTNSDFSDASTLLARAEAGGNGHCTFLTAAALILGLQSEAEDGCSDCARERSLQAEAPGCGQTGPNGYKCTHHNESEHLARGTEENSLAVSWPRESLVGDITLEDAVALNDWVTEQDPSDDDSAASVSRQAAFTQRLMYEVGSL